MAKLNQIIAVEKGIKSRVYSEVGELDKAAQKPELFNGLVRTYEKKFEDDEELPGENKMVHYEVGNVLRLVRQLSTELFDITARKDWSNCEAKADVAVEGKVILTQVPVTYLLFLEKQLTDLRTLFGRLPTLDEGEAWTKDGSSGLYVTAPTTTHRTKKVQRPLVLYQATVEHPAQTQVITEDVLAGYWKQTKQSGAMPRVDRVKLVDRIEKLLQAVKAAREAANGIDEVKTPSVGGPVFNYLLES